MCYLSKGYKHYWRFRPASYGRTPIDSEESFDESLLKMSMAKYEPVLRDCRKIILATCEKMDLAFELGSNVGIFVNGTGEEGFESFLLKPQVDENELFDYCKTNRKPYDTVITACLIVLSSYMGKELVQVLSDGGEEDWQAGLALARSVLQPDQEAALEIPASVVSGPGIVPRTWLAYSTLPSNIRRRAARPCGRQT